MLACDWQLLPAGITHSVRPSREPGESTPGVYIYNHRVYQHMRESTIENTFSSAAINQESFCFSYTCNVRCVLLMVIVLMKLPIPSLTAFTLLYQTGNYFESDAFIVYLVVNNKSSYPMNTKRVRIKSCYDVGQTFPLLRIARCLIVRAGFMREHSYVEQIRPITIIVPIIF